MEPPLSNPSKTDESAMLPPSTGMSERDESSLVLHSVSLSEMDECSVPPERMEESSNEPISSNPSETDEPPVAFTSPPKTDECSTPSKTDESFMTSTSTCTSKTNECAIPPPSTISSDMDKRFIPQRSTTLCKMDDCSISSSSVSTSNNDAIDGNINENIVTELPKVMTSTKTTDCFSSGGSSTSSQPSNSSDHCQLDKSDFDKENSRCFITKSWSLLTNMVHREISRFVLTLSMLSARNPKRTIGIIILVSFVLIGVGFFTNFNLQVDYEKVYAPFDSVSISHKEWIDGESGFPKSPRPLTLILHNRGENVLGRKQVELLFEALDTVRGTPGYSEICQTSTHKNRYGERDCKVFAVTRFWDHSANIFHQEVHDNHQAIKAMSAATFPGGTPVYTELLFGYPERKGNVVDKEGSHKGAMLKSAQSYFLRVDLPDVDGVKELEKEILRRLGHLSDQWDADSDVSLKLTYLTRLSYEIEFERAINQDLILVPFVVLIMSGFTCLVFFKCDRVQSRCLLGLGAVAAVGLSLMTGYGLMFLCGVPFTSMSQILPFIVFGVGLDDTFIITGAYFRTNPNKDTVERIRETMLEVGQSISLTTITTMLAFILGCMSSIPAIRWVCLYSFVTLFLCLLYQITFFVALLVLDEQRVKSNRKDVCVWSVVEREADRDMESSVGAEEDANDDENISGQKSTALSEKEQPKKNFADRFMQWYTTQLMRPRVQFIVIVLFGAYFGFSCYCTTHLTQQFRSQDFVPADSHVKPFLEALNSYSDQVVWLHVYFRGVDQNGPKVQEEMRYFMKDLMATKAVNGARSPFCWVIDFEEQQAELEAEQEFLKDLSFSDKLTLALNNPAIREAYGDDIVLGENGTIVASRCWLNPSALDLDVVKDQTDFLHDQMMTSMMQPINEGLSAPNFKFFTYNQLYFIWEFYQVAVSEMIFTTISGIFAVCFVGFFLIEHWSATAFVFPMIVVLYVDLLGTLQFAGLHVNVVTYVCIVTSIGLLVDFLMHIILRYYESPGKSREAKVTLTLETMGASILVGGLSTFLGTIPLAFSTSAILRTVFTAFFSMITLGVTHGLILLPVILSLVGPMVCITPHNVEPREVMVSQHHQHHQQQQQGKKQIMTTTSVSSHISIIPNERQGSMILE